MNIGMTITNEPGVYKEGRHGIYIRNLNKKPHEYAAGGKRRII